MSQWNPANTPKRPGSSQAPIPLPQLPSLGYFPPPTHGAATTPTHKQNAPVMGSQTAQMPTYHNPSVKPESSLGNGTSPSPHISVVLRSTAALNQHEDADELGNDGHIESDLTPQYKMRIEEARLASQATRQARGTSSPASKATTPVPQIPTAMSPKSRTPAQATSTTETPKPKSTRMGRPKGWRPGMSYADIRNFGAEVAAANAKVSLSKTSENPQQHKRPGRPRSTAVAAAPSSGGVPKRRGRRPRAPSPTPRAIYNKLKPVYVPFLCEWEGCKAELHNLETLRKHIRIVHCSGPVPAMCLWGGCMLKSPSVKFSERDGLLGHVEARHITPFAWHVGDGPRISMPDKLLNRDDGNLPDYLFDKNGIQVTPSVRDQQIEDFATWKERRRQLQQLRRRINDALPDEEESTLEEEDEKHPGAVLGGVAGHHWPR
ncbi:hypothetical protein jhhlp_004360 [Lomentospora prolificans]|uniref:C2H2-type domain-containing protein n=1 Tax=Lomentospora prolificans TaxID=41688 RepID=A0A2N3NBD1_9PEZI|nr:hypothetical protein jhhlp_004360 [Lomentospora prolificans]